MPVAVMPMRTSLPIIGSTRQCRPRFPDSRGAQEAAVGAYPRIWPRPSIADFQRFSWFRLEPGLDNYILLFLD
jgi:hypothetical protein